MKPKSWTKEQTEEFLAKPNKKPKVASAKKRPEKAEDGLNGTEREFLRMLRERGLDPDIWCHTLRLADNTRYIPDFSAVVNDRYTFFEVKGGYIFPTGWLKLKIAAHMYPHFDFILAQKKGGKWKETLIVP